MSAGETTEIFGHLLHGTARAWRQKLDQRLKPMGLSQAKWRTLMHLSLARRRAHAGRDCRAAGRGRAECRDIVASLGARRLDYTHQFIAQDRRCKMVLLGRRAQRVIAQINSTRRDTSARIVGRHSNLRSSNVHGRAGSISEIAPRKATSFAPAWRESCRRAGWPGTTARLNVEIRFQEKGQFAGGPNER